MRLKREGYNREFVFFESESVKMFVKESEKSRVCFCSM